MIPSYAAVISAIALLAVGCPAHSQMITRQQAAAKVIADQVALQDLYEHVPQLRKIGNVVREDCRARTNGHGSSARFCSCAVAVTMRLWRSGIDPNMLRRLQDFIDDPAASPHTFTAYEGPELYAPLCHLAVHE